MSTSLEEARIIVGGPQGSGLETAAQVLVSAYAKLGYRVYSTREYFSNIKGRHSYINIRVSSKKQPSAPREEPNIIAAIDAETVLTHFVDATKGTIIVYDKATEKTSIDKIPSMENELKQRVQSLLTKYGYPATVEGAIQYASEVLGAEPLPLNYNELLAKLAEKTGISRYLARRYLNSIPISIIALATGLDIEELREGFERRFQGRKAIIENNVELARIVYEYGEKLGIANKFRLKNPENPPAEYFVVSGNDSVAMGKVVGGLRVQTYYPITPAADESFMLEAHEDLDSYKEGFGGIIVFQTEDEIAAISSAIGAALTGARAATATSGPGFDLMVEALGWAGMNEVPVVITYYQRGGPSTGLPTRGGQQDLFSALFSGHGEFPRIILASGDHEEAFYDAIKALNWAERYQLPVIHLLDKFLANSIITMTPPNLERVNIDRGQLLDKGGPNYKRFDKSKGPISPRAVVGADETVSWYTGDEHDEYGHISEDPENRLKMHEARMKKLEIADKEIPVEERAKLYSYGSDFLLVGWGSVKGAALEALEVLAKEGLKGSFLQIRVFEPFPRDYVARILNSYPRNKIIAIEANYTSMAAKVITMNTGFIIDRFVLKWTGRPIYVGELVNAVKNILEGRSRKEVLKYGA
ncbi:2-oxoacid:ferredoxin oxidoreductase subunit alpha [Pyrofollis japonicus]|uniref:2-oxoacid:ferredoxin oxidoreductase subunit alpha n=1 Tax=Pyrofollis japonicus TaxID=3060460 RepID=UPI00295BDD79|nr:2-oxoacid:ferredoxin oxidoreductase subunit alpha [Pyrofollis japonicus]